MMDVDTTYYLHTASLSLLDISQQLLTFDNSVCSRYVSVYCASPFLTWVRFISLDSNP